MTSEDHRKSGNEPTGAAVAKPRRPGQEPMRASFSKRFYKSVDVIADGSGFQIRLDGRPIKTPKKRLLELPRKMLADAVAAEWQAQVGVIDPGTMPVTRIANTAIDGVANSMSEVAADIVAFAGSDLLCYRACDPAELLARQAVAWDPVLAWVQKAHGARFVLSEGVMPVEQSDAALKKIASVVAPFNPFQLTALHVLTTLTGSALLALAFASEALSLEEVWTAAHVDEDWQILMWGPDEEAAARRELRRLEFDAAAQVLTLLRS